MDRQQLLKKLGLSQQELDELIIKTRHFLRSLNLPQRRVVEASLQYHHRNGLFGDDAPSRTSGNSVSQGGSSQNPIWFCVPEGNEILAVFYRKDGLVSAALRKVDGIKIG